MSSKVQHYWLSTPAFPCYVQVEEGIVEHHSAVLVRHFWALPVARLLAWAHRTWGQAVRWEPLPEEEPHGE